MYTPVILLSGFLGSGKTTLLLSLIEESKRRGLRPGILMNELGKRDVDGHILEEHSGVQVQKLLDGCVCCSRKSELPDSLLLLLKQRPDAIYIELTGVADPDEIQSALLEPAFKDRLRLHHTITLVDAENALEFASRFSADKQLVRTLRKQLETADLIAVNKSDLVSSDTLSKIEKMARKHNEAAAILFTTFSKIDFPDLFRRIAPPEPMPSISAESHPGTKAIRTDHPIQPVHDHAKHASTQSNGSFSNVSTVTLTFPPKEHFRPLSEERLESFFQGWGDTLMRAKGHVALDLDGPIRLVQYAGGRTAWEESRYPGSPYLVCIGMNLDGTLLKEKWNALFQ